MSTDPKRFAGKIGVNSGAVQLTKMVDPCTGKPVKYGESVHHTDLRPEAKKTR